MKDGIIVYTNPLSKWFWESGDPEEVAPQEMAMKIHGIELAYLAYCFFWCGLSCDRGSYWCALCDLTCAAVMLAIIYAESKMALR